MNGWNNTNVTVNWSCTDSLSGAVSPIASQTVATEGLNQNTTGLCTDNTGNSASNTQSGINIDKTAPTLAPTVSPNPIFLNGTATAASGAADALSGIASESCNAVVTSSVGNKTVVCMATDNAGNTASANASYQVVFNFVGFFQPIDNLPIVNVANAGQAIPIKFSLSGNQGLAIFADGYPTSGQVECDTDIPLGTFEPTDNPGGSGLSYSGGADQYHYVWKTDKQWKGTCRILAVRFIDGTDHFAKFRFK